MVLQSEKTIEGQGQSPADINSAPLVSVIIPTYNSELFLRDCLNSIVGQTYRNTEIIIIDDGSTDDTLSIIDSYASSDYRILALVQDHAGSGVARNTAIDAAHGDYLYFLDSDDYAEDCLLEKAISRLERDGSDLAVFPFYRQDGRVNESIVAPWGCRRDLFAGEIVAWRDNPDFIFEAFQNYAWNKVFRNSFIQEHHLRFQELFLTEDLMFSACALAKATAISPMDDVLVTHRDPVGTSLMSGKDKHPYDFLTAFKSFKKFLEDEGLMDGLRIGYCRWAANACLYNLHTLNAWDSFCDVYQKLANGEASALGLFDVEIDAYPDCEIRLLLEALGKHMETGEYLFRIYQAEQAQRDFEWFCGRVLDNRLSAEQDAHANTRRLLDQAQQHLEEIYASETWKVGRFATALPRAIKTATSRNGSNRNGV